MRDIKLTLRAVDDLLSRNNFELIKEFLNNIPFSHFKGKHFEYIVSAGGTWNIPHNLGFSPQDVITTFNTAGTLTWNYASFSKTHIDFTTTDPGTVRAFIGSYKEM